MLFYLTDNNKKAKNTVYELYWSHNFIYEKGFDPKLSASGKVDHRCTVLWEDSNKTHFAQMGT